MSGTFWFIVGFVAGWVAMGVLAMRIAAKDELRAARRVSDRGAP